tara:strand:- start:4781 stop:4999 length:219 start_codon:yes stop_codon:yes gene_type:complete
MLLTKRVICVRIVKMAEPCFKCRGSGRVYERDPYSEGNVNVEECSCQKIGGYVRQDLPLSFNLHFNIEETKR